MSIIIGQETYDIAVRGLAELKPCPFAGVVTGDQVKLALGELLDVWSASVAEDLLAQILGPQ